MKTHLARQALDEEGDTAPDRPGPRVVAEAAHWLIRERTAHKAAHYPRRAASARDWSEINARRLTGVDVKAKQEQDGLSASPSSVLSRTSSNREQRTRWCVYQKASYACLRILACAVENMRSMSRSMTCPVKPPGCVNRIAHAVSLRICVRSTLIMLTSVRSAEGKAGKRQGRRP